MRILVNERIGQAGIDLLKQEHNVDTYKSLTQKELINIIAQYDALIVRGDTEVSKEVIEAGTKLKVIGRAGLEVEHIDIQAATQKGIMVLNAPQGNSASSIEYTLAMILALSRKIPQAYLSLREGNWDRDKFIGSEIKDKVLGIVGLGRVGLGVAQRALAFKMHVLVYDPFISEQKAKEIGISQVDLEFLLSKADYITLHLPATVDTRKMFNKEVFSKMKKGVRLINCAHAEIIDQDALIWALQEGIVAGAALDAWDELDKQSSALLSLPNIICTPRIAPKTQEAETEVGIGVARGVLAALRSEPVSTSLNIPPVSKDNMEKIMPYLLLSEKIGTLAVQLTAGRIKSVEVKYNGGIAMADTKMLTLRVLKAVLNPFLQEDINYVNASEVAKARGIVVKEVKSKEAINFIDLITVTVETERGEHKVAGTLFGKNQGRIVEIDNFRVDVDPVGWLLLVSHEDIPGIAGKIGTVLGEKQINITEMQIVRAEAEDAFAIIVNIRTDIEDSLVNRLKKSEGILNIKKVHFGE
ncbi:MAG: phosphoglycerate dehydrogenase [Peptococcaceae bacterium]|nr:phosphoglycerate dehydrogenase [Peptococcaceae bacterium]